MVSTYRPAPWVQSAAPTTIPIRNQRRNRSRWRNGRGRCVVDDHIVVASKEIERCRGSAVGSGGARSVAGGAFGILVRVMHGAHMARPLARKKNLFIPK